MNKIPLYWFNKCGKYGNFGDELGPYIINKLSGRPIYQIYIPRSSLKLVLAYVKGLIYGKYSFDIFRSVIRTLSLRGKYIVSVGSIIGWGSGQRIVWGSGIVFRNDDIDDGVFLAVRGKYTQQRLKSFGYDYPKVLGDPALLLPLIYDPPRVKKNKIGIVPHHRQYKSVALYGQRHAVKVINLLDDIEKIIQDIVSCEYIISSSLHGLIVSHAYKIPAIWYRYPKIMLFGDDVKYLDYFSSVGIDEYEPFVLEEIDDFDPIKEIERIKLKNKSALINFELKTIQACLLKVAPFPVDEKYLALVN